MFTWIADNLATIAICLFLAAIVTAIILKLVRVDPPVAVTANPVLCTVPATTANNSA